ncbi:9567_t:CDS:2, partial [Paraglomus occultum]
DSIEQLYAFFYKPHPKHTVNDGWSVYDPLREFERMGVTKNDAWRFSTVNRNYSLCPSYPRILVVPSKISDAVLTHAQKFRSKGRIPTLSYLHWANQ